MDSSKDLILLVGLGVLVLVGVFATDLAVCHAAPLTPRNPNSFESAHPVSNLRL